ncbi:putative RPA12-13.7 kd subunit of DNA-directed RNA polymerase I [Meredithblackwellia eburnea MCA 4105]
MSQSSSSDNKFGSLIFCERCGSLLDLPGDDDDIVCDSCGKTEDATSYENQTITTRSNPLAFPSSLRQKKTSLKASRLISDLAQVDELCGKCGYTQMSVKTMQLRSADEGATVFYSCEKCGNETRLNN